MWLMAPLEPDGYLWSVILCLFSCVVIGFGVFLQVKADAILLAAEGMSLAFVKLFKWEFGAVKPGWTARSSASAWPVPSSSCPD